MDKIEIAEKCWESAIQSKSSYYRSLYRDLRFEIEYPVLDIGGGAGTFLKYNGVKEATILDVAGGNSLVGNYKFINTNITQRLPELNKKFKTIFVMEVLEHIKNPLYIMSQVYDLLEDYGRVYIAIPYTPLDPKRVGGENPFYCHVCRWTKNEIIDQMQKTGFVVRVIQQRRRFKNTAIYLPHCWLVLKLKKRRSH